ncbi:hypothetical protein DYBT9623_04291 [Dyadobacter sp. CECT 9623]|uniref:Uncharacterized protein n=1 Tax=Dyadobacter linearis TaxID=2823330 RepID=A0ABM8UVB8_9BACT|nr:hypothetical protein DYBT9623_04291 [Dyadobacter sp. CECT 9623]
MVRKNKRKMKDMLLVISQVRYSEAWKAISH